MRLTEAGPFADAATLRHLYAALGADGSRPMGVSCGAGISAAHAVRRWPPSGSRRRCFRGPGRPGAPIRHGPSRWADVLEPDFDRVRDRRASGSQQVDRYAGGRAADVGGGHGLRGGPRPSRPRCASGCAMPSAATACPPGGARDRGSPSGAGHYGWAVSPEACALLRAWCPASTWPCARPARRRAGVVVQTPIYPPICGARQLGPAPDRGAARRRRRGRMDRLRRPCGMPAMAAATAPSSCATRTTRPAMSSAWPRWRAGARPRWPSAAIVSDEIHCDLTFDGRRHVPVGACRRRSRRGRSR